MLKNLLSKLLGKKRLENNKSLESADDLSYLNDYDNEKKFSKVYKENLFKGEKSRSGEGSDLVQTAVIRSAIPELLQEYNIKTMVDAPCGDWFWMREVDLGKIQYTGIDIVPDLIQKNNNEFSSDNVSFKHKNIAQEIVPQTDVILCRDCLVHLSFADAVEVIKNFKKSGSIYLLTTTFTERNKNEDLGSGFWRVLNMQQAPFNFPAPLRLINEKCTEGHNQFTDKCLGLWKLSEINL